MTTCPRCHRIMRRHCPACLYAQSMADRLLVPPRHGKTATMEVRFRYFQALGVATPVRFFSGAYL